MNAERQAIEAQVLEEALHQVDERLSAARANTAPPLILASGRGWHPGVIGIVASRLKDKYERPSLVVAFDEKGEGKGSGRSLSGVDLGRAVTAALEAGLLVNGGGLIGGGEVSGNPGIGWNTALFRVGRRASGRHPQSSSERRGGPANRRRKAAPPHAEARFPGPSAPHPEASRRRERLLP